MKKFLAVLLTLTMLVSVGPMWAMAEEENEYTVAWIGGSFTEGTSGGLASKCFVKLVTDWMNETNFAGEDTINCVNAGVGGTTSDYGRMRYEKDVLAHDPDLVIIEFAGNDSIKSDMSSVVDSLESMIRRTIAVNPETKIAILLRPDWGGAVEANEYHKLVADYYNIPVIDTASMVEANPEWVLPDGVHPNETGHAMIAEAIKKWLTENEIKAPTNKQFPINPNYTPIVPVYKNVVDLYDEELSDDGWEVQDGMLVCSTYKSVLYLNVKGTAFSFPAVSGSTALSNTFLVDSKLHSTLGKETSRKTGYINGGGHCQGTYLDMGAGEHIVKITHNDSTGKTLKLNKIIVDGLAYGEVTTTEALKYEVFHDAIAQNSTSEHKSKTPGGGVVTNWSEYGMGTREGDEKGLIMHKPGGDITYTLEDTSKHIGSVNVRSLSNNANAENIRVFAIDAENRETQLPLIKSIKHDGSGTFAASPFPVEVDVAYNVPVGTVKIKVVGVRGQTAQWISDVKYAYAAPIVEGITIETTETAIEGESYPITVKGNMSNGSFADLKDVDIAVYSSDSNVVSVDMEAGTIIAKNAGKAVLYAETTIDGVLYEASFDIKVFGQNDFDEVYFEVDKTNYTEGTSGKVDFVTVTDGVKEVDKFGVSYSSSNTSVLTVENDGTFTAVSEGTAEITPVVSALDMEFEPITINVVPSNVVRGYIREDIESGKLSSSIRNENTQWYTELASLRTGTALFGIAAEKAYVNYGDTPYLLSQIGHTPVQDKLYVGYVYKLEGELTSAVAEIQSTTTADVQNRNVIAYLTDDTITTTDSTGKTRTFDSADLTGARMKGLITTTASNGAYKLRPEWSVDSTATYNQVGTTGGYPVYNITSTNIPEGAKYMVVFINHGKLEDGSAGVGTQRYRFAGVKLNYKTKLVADEITKDGKLALTYSADIEDRAITVKVNDTVVDADVTYDAETFTSYIDADYSVGDTVKVTVDGICEFEKTFEDTREQIVELTVKDQDGVDMPALFMGQTGVNVTAKIKNSDDAKVQLFIGYYNGDKLEKVAFNAVDVVDGVAEISDSLAFGEEATEGNKVKVFLWNENLAPFANYKDFETSFEMSDF